MVHVYLFIAHGLQSDLSRLENTHESEAAYVKHHESLAAENLIANQKSLVVRDSLQRKYHEASNQNS